MKRWYGLGGILFLMSGSTILADGIAAYDRVNSASDAMQETTPTTKEGIGALAALLWSMTGPSGVSEEDFLFEANYGENQLLRSIWTACTGRSGYPETGALPA